MHFELIIFNQLKTSPLTHVQISLSEKIFETLVISIDVAQRSRQAPPPPVDEPPPALLRSTGRRGELPRGPLFLPGLLSVQTPLRRLCDWAKARVGQHDGPIGNGKLIVIDKCYCWLACPPSWTLIIRKAFHHLTETVGLNYSKVVASTTHCHADRRHKKPALSQLNTMR